MNAPSIPFTFDSSWPMVNTIQMQQLQSPPLPAKHHRSTMACMECRLAKTRCILATSPLLSCDAETKTCERCQRHHFRCLFVNAKRGRKAKSKLAAALVKGSESEQASQTSSSQVPPFDSQDLLAIGYQLEENPFHVTHGNAIPPPRISVDEDEVPYDDLIVNRSVTLQDLLRPFSAPSYSFQYAEGQDSSQSNAYDCEREDEEEEAVDIEEETALDPDDPVSSGIIAEDAARALFTFFMEHMTRWSNLLDRRLHTHDFVRRRSPFLYVAILSTAAKFSLDPSDPQVTLWCAGLCPRPLNFTSSFFPSSSPSFSSRGGERLRQLLYVLCQDLAARAFADGDQRSVECCQAFILTSCWRSMHDGVGSLQFGFALRLGCDLKLDAAMPTFTRSDTSSSEEEKQIARSWGFLNRQRTFLVLFIMDKAQQIVNDLDTRTIPHNHRLLSQSTAWHNQAQSAVGDGLLCACVEFRKVQDKYVSLLRDLGHATNSPSSAKATRSWLLDAILADLGDCEQRWQSILKKKKRGLSTREVEDDDTPTSMSMLSFWRHSISLHLCCSLLSLGQEQEIEEDASGDSRYSSSTRVSRILQFWDARRRGVWQHTGEESTVMDSSSLPSIPPLLHSDVSNQCSRTIDSILLFHCTASAQGVLDALSSLPPLRLRTTPDPTVLQCLHAATVIVSAALSPPPSSSSPRPSPSSSSSSSFTDRNNFAASVFKLVSRMRDSCEAASLSSQDTIHHIAEYMANLLDYMREVSLPEES